MIDEIDYDALSCAVLEVLDESLQDTIHMDTVMKTAELVWDDTAVQVKCNDSVLIFDLLSYELQDYRGYDA